jgi:preprotein translocase subunit SecE
MSENNETPVENEKDIESTGGELAGTAQVATSFGLMRYVHAIFFGGAIALAWLFIQIVDTAWARLYGGFGAIPAPREWMTVVIGAFCGFGMAFYLWRHPRVNRLVIEIVTELSKVSWPSRKELSASTVVVIVVSIIASFILGMFDMAWAKITDLILKI